MLAQLRQEHPRIAEAGAHAAAVMMGAPDQVGRFCAERDVRFGCFADPDRSAYRAFGLTPAGPGRWLFNRRVLRAGLRLFRRGVASGLPRSGQDVRQMPGTFVVSLSGRIRIAHYHADASDNPSIDLLLDALGAG